MRILILLVLFFIPVRSVYAVYYPFDYSAVSVKPTEQQIASFISSLPSTHTYRNYVICKGVDGITYLNVVAFSSPISVTGDSSSTRISAAGSSIHRLGSGGSSSTFNNEIVFSGYSLISSGVYTNTPPAPDPEPTPTPDPIPVPVPGSDDDDDGLGGKSCDDNIIAEFLRIALAINLWFFNKLPTVSLPDQAVKVLDDYFSLIDGVSNIVPLSHFFSAISFLIVLYNFRFFITLWNFIVSKIPFIGG